MDDEDAIRELTSQLLGTLGYEVTAVPDGLEAVKLYEETLAPRKNKPGAFDTAQSMNNLAWLLATCPEPKVPLGKSNLHCNENHLALAPAFRKSLSQGPMKPTS